MRHTHWLVNAIPLLALLLLPSCESAGRGEEAVATEACSRDSLTVALDTIAARSGGRMSLSFVDVAADERFDVRGDQPIFMASVMKLPLAVQILARVDAGELRLSDTVRVTREQLSLGRTSLVTRFPDGFTMRVDSLLLYAVSEGDNTAADALIRYSGGPRRVTAGLRELGIGDVRIDRNYLRLGWDLFGGGALPPEASLTKSMVDSVRALAVDANAAVHDSLSAAFATQPEDRATTDAVADLLARIARADILSDTARALLLRYMTESNNPRGRIIAGAPNDADVAHKSGTWSDWNDVYTSLSDVGIVTLADGRELALAIMVAQADAADTTIEAAIADATRAVLDDWRRCPAR